jgi:hypothetical protein
VTATLFAMHLNVFRTYLKELDVKEVPDNAPVSVSFTRTPLCTVTHASVSQETLVLSLLSKGIHLYSGAEDNVNWKLVCHMVQAQSSYLAQTLTQHKSGKAIEKQSITSLLACVIASFQPTLMLCLQKHLSEQQFVGVFAPLFVTMLSLTFECEASIEPPLFAKLHDIAEALQAHSKIFLPSLAVSLFGGVFRAATTEPRIIHTGGARSSPCCSPSQHTSTCPSAGGLRSSSARTAVGQH